MKIVATGVGSLPGTDFQAACDQVLRTAPELPYLPELPGRGPRAGIIGRGAAVLVDMPVELRLGEWRLSSASDGEARAARALLADDLDRFAEQLAGFDGWLKVSLAGVWTLTASLRLPRGNFALTDVGAVRDIADSYATGVGDWVALAAERLDGRLIVQFDDPLLPAVAAGTLRSASGLHTLPAVPEEALVSTAAATATAARAAGAAGVIWHCCAPGVSPSWMREIGVDGLSADLSLLAPSDELASAIEGGLTLWPGAVSTSGKVSPVSRIVSNVQEFYRVMGFGAQGFGAQGFEAQGFEAPRFEAQEFAAAPVSVLPTAITPTCGLAGVGDVDAVVTACAEVARRLAEQWGS